MDSRAKALGHPIHPMLIVFPLGLLVASLVCDIIYFITANKAFETVAFWNIAIGVIGGLLAAVFRLVDWVNIPANTRAKQVGLFHGVGNAIVVVLFVISWIVRLNSPDNVAGVLPFILSIIGILLGTVTAWLGGELVDRLGVGVYPDANLDAPSSLSSQPANPTMRAGAKAQ